jgi:long-chain fatty acid transport protein
VIKQTLIRKLAITTLILLPTTTMAGGIWLNEYGDPSQGRASAGSAAGTDNASTAAHNAAAMSRLDSDQVMVTGGFIYSKVEFDVKTNGLVNGDGDGGDAGATIPTGSAFYARQVNEATWIGVSLAGWSGAGLDYDDDWTGRYQTTEVTIVALALMPVVSYEVNDKLSLGFGLPIMYTSLEMDLAVPDGAGFAGGTATLDGDDTLVAVNFSALYEFTDQTRIGAVYNSEFDADYDGNIKTTGGINVSAETNLILAAKVRVSMSHDFNQSTTGHISWGWEDWSSMKNVTISAENGGASLPRNWDDTYHYAAGVTHSISSHWRINAGVAFDTDPVDKEDRTADLPIDRQIRYAFGVEHIPDKGPTIAGSLVYADYGNAPIQSDGLGDANLTGFSGDYKSNDLVFFSISANWKLGQ